MRPFITHLIRVFTLLALSLAGCGHARLSGPPAQPSARASASLPTQTITLEMKRPLAKEETVCFELVQVPAGRITIKDAAGRDVEHEVRSFWIARHETRWDEYNIFWMGLDLTDEERQAGRWGRDVQRLPDERAADWHLRQSTDWQSSRTEMPYLPPHGAAGGVFGEGYPADCIHFRAARKYCAWLSKHTGKRFRLPTEAEWEYACCAGGPPVKLEAEALGDVAWYKLNAADLPYGARPGTRFDDDYGRVHTVGQKRSNLWGLYDMLGNVGEYVIRDPNDDKGLLAGGSYKDDAKDVHSGAREPFSKDWQKNDPQDPPMKDWLNWSMHHAGFRVVMEE